MPLLVPSVLRGQRDPWPGWKSNDEGEIMKVKIILVAITMVLASACGPLSQPPKPILKLGGYQLQRADCVNFSDYLTSNAVALTLFQQLGGSIIQIAAGMDSNASMLSTKAGFDYAGIVFTLLRNQLALGIRPNEIPNTFLLRPLCHEIVPSPYTTK